MNSIICPMNSVARGSKSGNATLSSFYVTPKLERELPCNLLRAHVELFSTLDDLVVDIGDVTHEYYVEADETQITLITSQVISLAERDQDGSSHTQSDRRNRCAQSCRQRFKNLFLATHSVEYWQRCGHRRILHAGPIGALRRRGKSYTELQSGSAASNLVLTRFSPSTETMDPRSGPCIFRTEQRESAVKSFPFTASSLPIPSMTDLQPLWSPQALRQTFQKLFKHVASLSLESTEL